MNYMFSRSLALALLLGGAAWAQDEEPAAQDPNPAAEEHADEPAGEKRHSCFSLSAAYSLWVTDSDFSGSTAAEHIEVEAEGIAGIDISGLYTVNEQWSIRMGAELSMDSDIEMFNFTAGAVYDLDLFKIPAETHLQANLIYGTLDIDEAPGDFDNAIGFEIGAGAREEITEGLYLSADILFRHLVFDFEADPILVSSDDEVGGAGVRFVVGLTYQF